MFPMGSSPRARGGFFYRFLVCHNCARSKKTKDDALRRPGMAIKTTEANQEFRPYQHKNFLHPICSPVASGTDISTVLGSVASSPRAVVLGSDLSHVLHMCPSASCRLAFAQVVAAGTKQNVGPLWVCLARTDSVAIQWKMKEYEIYVDTCGGG
jgi:hypothetical protein